jgi:hypothetical protein
MVLKKYAIMVSKNKKIREDNDIKKLLGIITEEKTLIKKHYKYQTLVFK